MILRRGTPADVQRLVEIEDASFDLARYSRVSSRQFRRHLVSPNSILVVAESEDGKVQGYALCLLHKGRNQLRFYSLAVSPDAQRGDVGRLLFEAVEQEAVQRRLAVQCEVRADNTKLKDRYARLGYTAYRTVADYYPDGMACVKYIKQFS